MPTVALSWRLDAWAWLVASLPLLSGARCHGKCSQYKISLNPHTLSLQGGHYLHFTNEETEAQRGEVIVQSPQVGSAGLGWRLDPVLIWPPPRAMWGNTAHPPRPEDHLSRVWQTLGLETKVSPQLCLVRQLNGVRKQTNNWIWMPIDTEWILS